MNEIERYRPGAARVRALSVPTRQLPQYGREVNGPRHGPKLRQDVTGVQVWSDTRYRNLQRRLKKACDRGEVAGAYQMPDRGDGRVYIEVQLLPRRPRNWWLIGATLALGGVAAGGAVWLVLWVAKLMAAVAAGMASVGGMGVLLLVGALLLAAGGGTVTVTSVVTIKRSLF